MRDYETMVIVDPDLDEDERAGLIQKFESAITSKDGTVHSTDSWGRRQLAYEVAGKNYGYYYLINFNGGPETVQELERVIKIADGAPKYLTIRRKKPVVVKAEPEKKPEPQPAADESEEDSDG
ncbi:MAG: 30S ribosomal protein S6 [Gemmatimonadota bacterium]|nr:30S ribosomal protein S6 [Gemmatimonadota bacterium]